MSLINQMLQDLDARRAAHGVGASLPNDVRPLPKAPPSRLPMILGLVVLLALAGGFVLYLREARTEAVPAVAPVAPVAAVPPPPAVIVPPAPEPEKAVPAEQPSVASAPPASILQELDGSLRMSEIMSAPAEKKAENRPVAADKKAVAERNKVAPAERVPALAAAATPMEAAKPARAPSIERTDSVGSARDGAETEYRKAIAAVNQGRVTEAIDGLRNALRADGLHVASRQLLVKLLLEAKRPEEAMQVLQEGLQGQPAQLGWAMSLARLQMDRGDLAGAWQTLNYALPAAGNNADYQGFAGHVLQRLGRHKEAADHYQMAARLAPGDGRWWLGLGLAMEAEGRSSEARETFLRARQSGNLSAELMALIEQKLR